jgi:hypothetical protein
MPHSVLVLLVLAAPAQGATPPEVTLVLSDGSILKRVTPPEAAEVVTKYGTLSVPFKDVRRVKVGLRLGGLPWLRAWEQDTITTADCVLTGRLTASAFKVRSKTLGEVRVKLLDVRAIHGAGDGPQQGAGGRPESNEQKIARNVAELMQRFRAAYKVGSYKEAIAIASLAHELDPDNPVPTAALIVARNTLRGQQGGLNSGRRDNMPPLPTAPAMTPPFP